MIRKNHNYYVSTPDGKLHSDHITQCRLCHGYSAFVTPDYVKMTAEELQKIQGTKLYSFYQKRKDLHYPESVVTGWIMELISKLSVLVDKYICLIHNNMSDVIYDLMAGDNSDDDLAIYQAAATWEKLEIIEALISRGFTVNQTLHDNENDVRSNWVEGCYNSRICDPLTYAIHIKSLPVIELLLENGADPYYNKAEALVRVISCENHAIFKYLYDKYPIDEIENYATYLILEIIRFQRYADSDWASFLFRFLISKSLFNPDIHSKYINENITLFSQDKIKILEEQGFVIDLDVAFINATKTRHYYYPKVKNERLKYLLDQYFHLINQKTITTMVDQLLENMNLPIFELLLQYDVDLSLVTYNRKNPDNVITLFDTAFERGMSFSTLKMYMLHHYEQYL